ncbi:hypothetical protein F4677DRAFT_406562 [Hypoxylon crocopeplum]|nr:hypothetical protein F4677DRAFT_406562 [Hypoxylon crocopeplum]
MPSLNSRPGLFRFPFPVTNRTLVLSIPPVLVSCYILYKLSPLNKNSAKKNRSHSEGGPSEQAGTAWSPKRNRWASSESDVVSLWSESSDEEDNEQNEEESEPRPPFEYYCMFRPFFDIENENEAKDEYDQVDEDDLLYQYNQEIRAEDNIEMKAASEHPGHRWIAMWQTWKLFTTWERRATYTNPDFFNMFINKHFHGYGMQEMVENMLIAFNREFRKKKRDKKNLKKMWAIVAAIMQWLLEIPLNSWIMLNDKRKLETTVGLIGRALVAALNELDMGKMLKADSDIKDLGLVITFYLYWIDSLRELNIELPFRKEVVAYARKAGIDLKDAGCFGTDEKIAALEKELGKGIRPFHGTPRPDRWEWRKKFKKFSKDHKIGGEKYNILKMSRRERASYAFDKKDPLADLPDKAIQEGNVRVSRKGHAPIA